MSDFARGYNNTRALAKSEDQTRGTLAKRYQRAGRRRRA